MNKPTKNSRLVAAKILSEWLENGSFPEQRLSKIKDSRFFVMEVVHGCIRKNSILMWAMNRWVKNPPTFLTQAIIHVGFYQILFMDNTEVYASINECVEASKKQPNGLGAAKLVNAVLRKCDRESSKLLIDLEKEKEFLKLSHPEELFTGWIDQYGEEKARTLAIWNNKPAKTIIRINQLRISADKFKEELNENNIECIIHPASKKEIFFNVPRGISVVKLPGYNKGWFTVQDPATIHAVDLLSPKDSESVLDACAAPGGKTILIAERMNYGKSITAMELHEDRIPRLLENLKRNQWEDIEVINGDARYSEKYLGNKKFDAILLDVPCSNTGVLQRRSDARWRVGSERMKELNKLQLNILESCSKLLNPNGRMVYSTCSLEQEENEFLIDKWMLSNKNFYLKKSIKIFPPDTLTDGGYAALICRN